MALQPGTRLGSFEVLGPLGAGGMGEVYRAHDSRLGRDVAIKVLPEAFARDPARTARFEREARLLAAINHPAIGAIYGAEEFDSLRCIIMELVPGETLAEKIARGLLSPDETCDLGSQIAEALEAAHEKGVIHRDLKPSNIKVTPEGKVKVLDLGLAKAMEPPQTEDLSRSPTMPLEETRPGVILGTVQFMSPEQARGKAVDKRTDIWAFGCVLFEMLSGRHAFSGETVADVLSAIITAEPDWSTLPEGTPPRLRELIGRCLQKDANLRLRDIGDARIELQDTSGRAPVPPQPFPSPFASRSLWIPVAAGLLVLLVAAGWLVLRQRTASAALLPPRISLAVLPFRDLSAQPNGQLLADGFAETLRSRLAKLPGIQVVTGVVPAEDSSKEKDLYNAASKLGANVFVSGSLQRGSDQIRIVFGVSNAARRRQIAADDVTGPASDLFRMQDEVADKVAASLRLPLQALKARAAPGLETASEQERYTEALGALQRYDKPASLEAAIQLLEGLRKEKPGSALVHAALGRAYFYKFNNTREGSWAELAMASSTRAREIDPVSPEANVTLGMVLSNTGKQGEAIVSFQRALQTQPNNYEALLGLGDAYQEAGNLSEAEATYGRAIALQPSTWSGTNHLGVFYYKHGRYAEAIPVFQRVLSGNPDNARVYSNLGGALLQTNRFEEALAAFRKSISLQPNGSAYSNAGTAEFFLGRYKEAAQDFQKAVALIPARHGFWQNLADAYHWSSSEPQAQEACEQAIRLVRKDLEINPRDGPARSRLAICLARTGKLAAAQEEMERATRLAANKPQVMYDAAIVAHVTGQRQEALAWIARAAAAGFSLEMIRREPEFADLRKEKNFEEALRPNAQQKSS
jgi:tetratricopeptide (TPR) repeat protein